MSNSNILQKWINEFCSPVVIIQATPEVEKISLKNGLLLHELFSCFGHLDGLNSNIKVAGQSFPLHDAHIRFERVTEVRSKSSEDVESLLGKTFQAFDLNKIPDNIPELKLSPPTAWNQSIEEIFTRSLGFSEFETISQPLIILSAISTNEAEPLTAMQDLISVHHTPTSLSNGQYDPAILRLYLLIEDVSEKGKDPLTILRTLNSKFPPAFTRLISINSFPASSPNVHQPDMWSRFLFPKFFPQHAPSFNPSNAIYNPTTNAQVLGALLSVDDFMKLQDFCIWLFNDHIIPMMERRLNNLHRIVNDSRKGMKNLMKSFWRKPRDESENVKGTVKYRYDKIESQTLQLADMSFMIKDYENALSNYKLVRDDFKSDKSYLHLSHALFMIALCQMITEPQRYKESFSIIENITQLMGSSLELNHANALFSLLCSELYMFSFASKSPLESAKVMLLGASMTSKYPIISALMMEKAALYFMQANQVRKYIFHASLSGLKLQKCGQQTSRQSFINYVSSLLLLEKGNWGDLKNKLVNNISQDLLSQSRQDAQRSLLLMLKILSSTLLDNKDVSNDSCLIDAVTLLNQLTQGELWGSIVVESAWNELSIREILLNDLPIKPLDITLGDITQVRTVVHDLPIPAIDMDSIKILECINGSSINDSKAFNNTDREMREFLQYLLDTEINWHNNINKVPNGQNNDQSTFDEIYAKAEYEMIKRKQTKVSDSFSNTFLRKVPLGERILVSVQITNKLPIDLLLLKMQVDFENQNLDFDIIYRDVLVNPESTTEIVFEAIPKTLGNFTLKNLTWNLSETFSIVQPLKKQGKLLQRTLQQRANYERSEDNSLDFQVVESQPLLQLRFDGLSQNVLQGQLLRSTLYIKNEGTAEAKDIYLKLSQPSFIFFLLDDNLPGGGKILKFFGASSTVVYLENVTIPPGQEIRLESWLRIISTGTQKISILASYNNIISSLTPTPSQAEISLASYSFATQNQKSSHRISFISIQTHALPSLEYIYQISPRLDSLNNYTLIAEITNLLQSSIMAPKVEERFSSIGQIELPNFSHTFEEIDDRCVKVIGLWIIGSAEKNNTLKTSSVSQPNIGLYASPEERITQCWPINYSTESKEVSPGSNSWLISLPETNEVFKQLSHLDLRQIVSEMLSNWYSVHNFTRKLHEAREQIISQELEAEASGPRSIQDVRRQRQNIQIISNETGEKAFEDNEEDPTSGKFNKSPDLKDVVHLEKEHNCVAIACIWVCRWEGKIRWGLHHMPYLPLLGSPKHSSMNGHIDMTMTHSHEAIKHLQFSIQHNRQIVKKPDQPARVSIQVSFRSLAFKPIILTLTVLNPSLEEEMTQINLDEALSTVPNTSFAWQGKLSYQNITIKPKEELSFSFNIEIYSPGMHDLNRFQILAKYLDSSDQDAPLFQRWPGQSLLLVTEETESFI